MRIEPQSEIVLARGLEDHSDSTTYYVQAVIRNAKTDAVIATVNLTDQGNRRFTKEWRVPSDPTGEGMDILITYIVYTDSGYTTKATNYDERFDKYRIEHTPKNPGGGGADIDYKRVRKIVEEVVSAELKTLPAPDKPEPLNIPFHLQPVMNALSGLRNDVKSITIPETDFSSIQFRLDSLERAIKAVKIPETDLSPVLEAVASIKDVLQPYTESMKKDSGELLESIRQYFDGDMEALKIAIKELEDRLSAMPFMILQQQPKTQQKQEENINYDQLLNR